MAGGMNIAGVIHQHVDRSEFGLHPVKHAVHLRLHGNIGSDGDCPVEHGRDFGGASFVEIVDHDAGTL